jgi:NAD(P)H-nitrite reductase large subunit
LLPENVHNPLARAIKLDEREETLDADLVVLATGLRPDDALYDACVRGQVAPEVHNLGDSFAAGRVFEAVKAGYRVGLAL